MEPENEAEIKRKGRCGRKHILQQQTVQEILNDVENTPFQSSTTIREHHNLHCSTSTIKKVLRENGVFCHRPAKKIAFTDQHKINRVRFSEENINRHWANVIFSDEKVFCSNTDSLKPLWRRRNTRLEEKNVLKTNRSGRISSGYWGWMSDAGPGELVKINGRFTATEYVNILDNVMLPSVRQLYPHPEPIVFVQDNSPIHTAQIVQQWFQNHEDIQLLNWPAKSPDLNPIENLWGIMVREWEDVEDGPNIRTADALDRHVNSVWERLRGRSVCENLVRSMRERLQTTINTGGLWTKY